MNISDFTVRSDRSSSMSIPGFLLDPVVRSLEELYKSFDFEKMSSV